MSFKIYLASSWRSPHHCEAVQALREAGFEVYDYRADGFSWTEIDPNWDLWDNHRAVSVLADPLALNHFRKDFKALAEADAVVAVMPGGLSMGIELGWAAGAGKHTAVWVPALREAELMIAIADTCSTSLKKVVEYVAERREQKARANGKAGFVLTA